MRYITYLESTPAEAKGIGANALEAIPDSETRIYEISDSASYGMYIASIALKSDANFSITIENHNRSNFDVPTPAGEIEPIDSQSVTVSGSQALYLNDEPFKSRVFYDTIVLKVENSSGSEINVRSEIQVLSGAPSRKI